MQGQVKWFSSERGYGFISSEDVENDIYVHFSDIQMKGFKSLQEGDKVEFDYDAEKQKATNVKIIADSLEENNTDNE